MALHAVKYIKYLLKLFTDTAAMSLCLQEFGSIAMNSLFSVCKCSNERKSKKKGK